MLSVKPVSLLSLSIAQPTSTTCAPYTPDIAEKFKALFFLGDGGLSNTAYVVAELIGKNLRMSKLHSIEAHNGIQHNYHIVEGAELSKI